MRQNFIGMVVNTAAKKTAKVRVAHQRLHPKVQKIVTRHTNFLVHDAREKCSVGDVVRIEACRKISKRKAFAVAEIIKPADTYTDPETGTVYR
ncbi:hypothetical protein H4R33_000031 [Dimargaris cristalligena]|uniref:30S ribosomal protein S17 n=1 Tax=Dimargaris cristalligena TaxID=215637 RepID=A0A4V1J5K7_9FUNG|nr:hypothetical protein H4R33_000031 [Dimargaris cristalligena]RKP39399.1 30S ribosomal protein S17 [Dimargaris cristalligena]|eukprot:RKP39399.1 30S ribosomal protein S17 [Dimargaris cristalligena]